MFDECLCLLRRFISHYFQGLRYRLSQTISADLQMSPSPLAGDVNISAGASLIAWRKWKTAAMAVGDVTETLEQLLPRLLPIQAWDPSSSPPTTHSSNSSTSTAIIPCNNVSSVVHTSSTSKARGESGECPAAPPSYHGIRLLSSTFASLLLEAAESFQNLLRCVLGGPSATSGILGGGHRHGPPRVGIVHQCIAVSASRHGGTNSSCFGPTML
eukprot:GHVT01033843.1.p1 GENE.GHVT01033843.1~~GHVT01033843.1.p1  ORF type:complete len:214 (-),score=20.17 GHVT01033843.1:317-958(-)